MASAPTSSSDMEQCRCMLCTWAAQQQRNQYWQLPACRCNAPMISMLTCSPEGCPVLLFHCRRSDLCLMRCHCCRPSGNRLLRHTSQCRISMPWCNSAIRHRCEGWPAASQGKCSVCIRCQNLIPEVSRSVIATRCPLLFTVVAAGATFQPGTRIRHPGGSLHCTVLCGPARPSRR